MVVGVWSSVAFAVFVTVAVGSMILRPVLEPVILRTLTLIAQSEKGVLTQLALATGGLAKAVQELLK
jgi:hypothetical protein